MSYLNIDCPECGRHRVEAVGCCEKCGAIVRSLMISTGCVEVEPAQLAELVDEKTQALRDECLGWHNRVEQLETAIDLALGRLRQRQVFINAQLPAAAEEALAAAEMMLRRCFQGEKEMQ